MNAIFVLKKNKITTHNYSEYDKSQKGSVVAHFFHLHLSLYASVTFISTKTQFEFSVGLGV